MEELQLDETILKKIGANYTEGAIARGGFLYLTNQRLIFSPHTIEQKFGGDAVILPLSQVVGVGKEASGCGPSAWFSGGLRARLRIDTAYGVRHLFVINKLDSVISQIQAQVVKQQK